MYNLDLLVQHSQNFWSVSDSQLWVYESDYKQSSTFTSPRVMKYVRQSQVRSHLEVVMHSLPFWRLLVASANHRLTLSHYLL